MDRCPARGTAAIWSHRDECAFGVTSRVTEPMTELAIAAQSDPGCDPAKAVNEDAYVTCRAACGTFLAVCDGMGGHDGGRVASTTAVQVLQSLIETAPADGASARFLRGSSKPQAAPCTRWHRPRTTSFDLEALA